MPVEAKSGGLVFSKYEDKVMVALVHDVFGYWTLVKSGSEEGESYEQTAIRSVKEKLGLEASIVSDIGKIEYVASHPEKKKILKVVAYFLMEAPYKELVLKSNGGLDKAEWMEPSKLVDLTIYDDILPSIAKAIEIINSKNM